MRYLMDHLWIEEKVVWGAALSTAVLFAVLDMPFSIQRVAGPYALFLGRIAAIVVLIVAVDRVRIRYLRRGTGYPLTVEDVWLFLRTLGFYLVALTTYTNLKTHTLLLNPRVYDTALETLDRWMFLGFSPTELALELTGNDALTAAMDTAYTYAWLPLAITFGLVFSQSGGQGFRRLARVISLNYLLGATLYVLLPAVGPAFANRELYEALHESRSFLIQNTLISVHNQILAAPKEFLAPAFMGIAAFPSLHVSHIYLPLLVAWKRARGLLVLFVPAFLAVAVSTAYFGWHWVIDIPAGMATIHLCLWLAKRLEPYEERARLRRAERGKTEEEGTDSLARGLGQWPVIAVLAALHLIGLIASFALLAPAAPLTWGSGAALVFFICFWVLLEFFLLTLLVGIAERWAHGSGRAWLDAAKAILLSGFLTTVLASLIKLNLTGTHLASLDLRFVVGNFGQLAGESSGTEIALGLGLVACFAIAAGLLFRGFTRLRRRPIPLPTRSFLLLGLLALIGTVYPVYRYSEARFMAPRVVPELGWMLSAPPPALLAATASHEPVVLSGPPIEPWEPQVAAERPNILFLLLESVPANVLESPQARAALPNVLELSRQATTFWRAYAPSVHSDYAQMSILSSLHPRKYAQHDYYQSLDYPRTLIWDLLRPGGWRTALFSSQNEGWGNMSSYLDTPGLELLRHSPDWPNAPHKGRGSESKVFEPTVVGAWQEWLDTSQGEPWFTYLNFQATHFPYDIPANAPRPFEPADIDFPTSFLRYPQDKVEVVKNRYLNALRYSDSYLGEIVRILKARGEWESTILVVAADHGEAFYEHGQPTHGTALFEEQVRSLLIVRLPGQPARRVDEAVSLMDVVPSLIDHLGLPMHGNFQGSGEIFDPDYSAAGRSFVFTIQGITSEDAILRDDWKYIVNWRTGTELLFDLATDPAERQNLAERRPDRVRDLGAELGAFLAQQLAYYSQAGWETGIYPQPLH